MTRGDIQQRHLIAVQQLLNVHQNQHTLAERAQTGQVFGRQRDRKLWRRTNLIRGQRKHVRHAIHHDPHHALPQIQDDHHGVVVVVNVALAELHAQIHDGHNDATQIGDTFNKRRRVSDAGNLVVTTDFLHFQDIDAVLFIA